MQVSQQDSHITHAVIGQQETTEMGMSNNAFLMHALSAALYTYPKLAAVREVICNGWDGHIMANKTDTPLKITVTSDEFKVQDFGPGIPHERIGPIYGTYGDSTKRDDETQTGGFGLGSKAPFAYVDSFELVSCYAGTKTIYRVSKSSMAVGGKPAINKIVSVPTDETGITVSYSLKPQDQHEFTQLVHEVLLLGGIPAQINMQDPVVPLPLLESPSGYIINSVKGTLLSRINVRYGNVVYPVPSGKGFENEWNFVLQSMNKLWQQANIIFMAEPNTVTIAPSREALIFDDTTVGTLKKLLGQFSDKDVADCEKAVGQRIQELVNKEIKSQDPIDNPTKLQASLRLPTEEYKGAYHTSGPYAYTLRKARVAHLMQNRSVVVHDAKLLWKRFEDAVSRKAFPDRKFAKAMRKALYRHNHATKMGAQTFMRACVHKYLTKPLFDHIGTVEKLDTERLFYGLNAYSSGDPELVRPRNHPVESMVAAVGFLCKRALVVRSKRAAIQFLRQYHHQGGNGWVVYVSHAHETRIAEAQEMFTKLGYDVYTHIPQPEKVEVTGDDGEVVLKPKKPAKRRKGYMSLSQSYDGKEFLINTAREKSKALDEKGEDGSPLKDPVAYIVLNNKSEGARRFGRYTEDTSRAINKLWGKDIAVVLNTQIDAMNAKGIPTVKAFVSEHVDKTLSAQPDFPRYLAFTAHAEKGVSRYNPTEKTLKQMVSHKSFMESVGLRFHVSAETECLIEFYKEGDSEKMPLCFDLAKKVKKHPDYDVVIEKLKTSPWVEFINMSTVYIQLEVYGPDHPKNAIPYEILRNILK